jgi:hypothetical protein
MTEPRFRRYIVFGYDSEYPAGGLGDIKASFDTLEDAQNCIRTAKYHDYWQIVDRDTWQEVPAIAVECDKCRLLGVWMPCDECSHGAGCSLCRH